MGNDKGIGPVGALGIGQQNLHAIFGKVIRIDRDPFIVRISYLKRHIHQNAIGIFFFQRGIAGKGFFQQLPCGYPPRWDSILREIFENN